MTEEWSRLLANIPGYDSEATADPTDYFDPDAAQKGLDFFPTCLKFIEGERAGEPFQLEPWQQAIVAGLWGWRRQDGTRRYREALLYVPRKSGKTPLVAALCLLALFTDGEPGAQLYSAAADRDQAALIYRHAAGMIAREPEMAKRVKTYRSFKAIEYPAQNAVFKALASDAASAHGLGASFVAVDELHAHRDGELVDVLTTSTAARRQPLVLYITTADYARESVCNRKYEYACSVRDGTISDRAFLPVIYEAAPDADWTDPEVWAQANPNLGVSVKREYLERECQRAQAEPSYQNTFRRLHLNQRTAQDQTWIDLARWDRCQRDLPDLTGRIAYGGLDLSTVDDLTAFVLAFPPTTEDEPYWLLPWFWLPEQTAKQRPEYREWNRDGHLQATPGEVIDYSFIRRKINELADKYHIATIAFDPHNSYQICVDLREQDGLDMLQHRQGFLSMSAPTKDFERQVIAKSVAHDGHPVLRWNLQASAIERDAADNIKVSKRKSTEKVDGVIAAIMALGLAVADGNAPSIYETRGIITI